MKNKYEMECVNTLVCLILVNVIAAWQAKYEVGDFKKTSFWNLD